MTYDDESPVSLRALFRCVKNRDLAAINLADAASKTPVGAGRFERSGS